MKLLLTGNHTCANRGDSAILRGLVHEILLQEPNAEIVCCSRYPQASSQILGRPVESEWISYPQSNGSTLRNLATVLAGRLGRDKQRWMADRPILNRNLPLPQQLATFSDRSKAIDAVIQVGGSFFVDLYGTRQFDVLMACHLTGTPIYLAGHSLGPFRIPRAKKFARSFLPQARRIFLREKVSQQMLDEIRLDCSNVEIGADTAWCIPDAYHSAIFRAELGDVKEPLVAVTVRRLAPFDRRLGISQEEYEVKLARLLNAIIKEGYHIVGVSMCTGLGGYHHDDRLVAESLRQRLDRPSAMTVLWHEYSDLEIGGILSECCMLLGTRLHSVILSLRYRTPALALYYEHKSEGVLKQLGLNNWSIELRDLDKKEACLTAFRILEGKDQVRDRIEEAVSAETRNAQRMVSWILDDITRNSRSPTV